VYVTHLHREQYKFQQVADIIHNHVSNAAMVWSPMQSWGYPWSGGGPYSYSTADKSVLDTNGDGVVDGSDDGYGPYYPGGTFVDWIGITYFHIGYQDGAIGTSPWHDVNCKPAHSRG
jgi:hypothetical protein